MRESRGSILVLGIPTVVGLWFVSTYASGYIGAEPAEFGIYWPRHQWLYVHIIAGIAALLLGPTQFWLALNRRTAILHRVLGIQYVLAVGTGAVTAYYLAFHTDFGWVFGMGLTAMATAWIVSTTLATIAICRKMVEQHREWMIRSYVVTFGFVTFRVLQAALDIAKVGGIVDRMSAASWMAWSIPLLIVETILQGRKIFVRRPKLVKQPISMPLQVENAYSAEPEPVPFDLPGSESTYLHGPSATP
jgi:uncharacterized membrane protein